MLRCSLPREVSLGRRLRALKRESEAGHRAWGRRVALSVGVAVGIAGGEMTTMRGAVQLEAVEGEQQRRRQHASGGSLLATRDRRRTKRPSRRRRRGGGACASAVLGGRCPG